MEHNANHIIPSYYYLPVGSRSLVDGFGSLGSCRHRFNIIFNLYLLKFFMKVGAQFLLKISSLLGIELSAAFCDTNQNILL